jgi:pyridoxamine 5'-phosphate oxidase-like protein
MTRQDLVKLKTRTKTKDLILQILDSHRVMAVATNRPDGWPQVTMVGYVNDGFLLYCFVDRNSQKCANILRDGRVSIAIGSDASKPCDIKGLSLAGRASIVTGESELGYVSRLRLQRYPEYAVALDAGATESTATRVSPRPSSGVVVLLRIEPEIFSVLDYSKGFGHSDLIAFSERDLDLHIESLRHRWDGNVL